MLKDYSCLLTVATFIGSITFFTDYLADIEKRCHIKPSLFVNKLAWTVILSNYIAIVLIWIVLLLLILFPNPDCNLQIYKYCINYPLIFSLSLLLITVIIKPWIKNISKLTKSYVDNSLLKEADSDVERLKQLMQKKV